MIKTFYQKTMDLNRFCKVYLDGLVDLDAIAVEYSSNVVFNALKMRTEVNYLRLGIPASVNERTSCLI